MSTFNPNAALRVLVLGGYGFFGSRLARRLAADPRFELTIAGRSLQRAAAFAVAIKSANPVHALAVDADDPQLAARLREQGVQIVVNASGPFQEQDYAVARACIAAGAHYIDLADGRAFVCGIAALDEEARRAGVCIISGASSVPALSGAVVEALGEGLRLSHIDIGIHPGNRTDRGLATVAAVLSYCGRPIRVWRDGAWTAAHGWSRHWRHAYPAPIGWRWTTHCDVPDLELFPARYPGVRSVRFGAGLELKLLHGGLALFAWLHRLRLLPRLSHFARPFKAWSDLFNDQGSDAGGMYVKVLGTDAQGKTTARLWHLIALNGDGPYVPTLAAAALLRKFAQGRMPAPGAMPCLGLLELGDFKAVIENLAIDMKRVV
jgi:saccharopine dehydrogenase-like NADP-dependent oxidoreductase